jgi:cytoplasmic iron level regulating protein YaaA (DUF328/UPF0246 family)
VLIIAPPSETKRQPPAEGPGVDLDGLAFPRLTPMRRRVLDALITTSASPDAFVRLHLNLTMAPEVARNTWLREVPTMAASDVYSGPFHGGLDVAGLSATARDEAEHTVVVTSPLWGLLRLADRIPPYRLGLFTRQVGMDQRLDAEWRQAVPQELTATAKPAPVIVDLRSPESQMIGKPDDAADRTLIFRVVHAHGIRIGDVIA